MQKYTSYDEVRSVLGVEDDELLDETLALPVYLNLLLEDLMDVNINTEKMFDDISGEDDPTPLQLRFLRLVGTFSTYSVARHLTTSLPMFAPRSLGDGKATMSRFLDPYKDTIKKIEEQFTLTQGRLQQVIDELNSETKEATTKRYFVGVGLSRDPVTGQ